MISVCSKGFYYIVVQNDFIILQVNSQENAPVENAVATIWKNIFFNL